MSGDVFNGKKEIRMQQAKLSQLWEFLGCMRSKNVAVHDGNSPQIHDDLEIYNKASSAENAKKFVDLWNGNWTTYHESQSEADMALVSMIAFYTPNIQQVKRMFWQSGLGKRPKAYRPSYIEPMLRKAYDQITPTLNFDNLFNELQEFRQTLEAPVVVEKIPQDPLFVHKPKKQGDSAAR